MPFDPDMPLTSAFGQFQQAYQAAQDARTRREERQALASARQRRHKATDYFSPREGQPPVPADLMLSDEEAIKALSSQQMSNMFTLGQIDPRFANLPQGRLPVGAKQAAGVAQTGFQQGQIPSNETQQIAEMARAPQILENLEKEISAGASTMGPVSGRVLPAAGQYLGMTSPEVLQSQKLKSAYEAAKQIVAKGLEGGVLRKEDMPKYQAILGANWLTPEAAHQNIAQLKQLLSVSYNSYLDMLQATGRSVPQQMRVFQQPVPGAVPGPGTMQAPPAPGATYKIKSVR